MVRRIDGEWWAAAGALAVAGLGWGIHATLLALLGTLGAITAVVLWVWARECLTGVTYSRTLAQPRAVFAEEVTLDIEMVNDKLLPLTWLHVAEEVLAALTIRGGTVLPGQSGLYSELHQLLPMLPYQRVRRRFTVVCNHRGEHTFGPTLLRSGNPVGYREKIARIRDPSLLLVYPKVFRLVFPTVASRMPLGDIGAHLSCWATPAVRRGCASTGPVIRCVMWTGGLPPAALRCWSGCTNPALPSVWRSLPTCRPLLRGDMNPTMKCRSSLLPSPLLWWRTSWIEGWPRVCTPPGRFAAAPSPGIRPPHQRLFLPCSNSWPGAQRGLGRRLPNCSSTRRAGCEEPVRSLSPLTIPTRR